MSKNPKILLLNIVDRSALYLVREPKSYGDFRPRRPKQGVFGLSLKRDVFRHFWTFLIMFFIKCFIKVVFASVVMYKFFVKRCQKVCFGTPEGGGPKGAVLGPLRGVSQKTGLWLSGCKCLSIFYSS